MPLLHESSIMEQRKVFGDVSVGLTDVDRISRIDYGCELPANHVFAQISVRHFAAEGLH